MNFIYWYHIMKRRSLQLKTQLMQFRKEGLKKFKFRLAGKREFFHNTMIFFAF